MAEIDSQAANVQPPLWKMKTFPDYLRQSPAAAVAPTHNWIGGLTIRFTLYSTSENNLPRTRFCVVAATIAITISS